MADHDRNPYVLLGVPFGASNDEVKRAYARRARGLRRAADGQEKRTALNWARNQVEEAIKDPASAVHLYRVPADPGALVPDEEGLFNPPPERMGRTSPPSDRARADLLTFARVEAATAARLEAAGAQHLPPR